MSFTGGRHKVRAPTQVDQPFLGEAPTLGAEAAQGRPPQVPWAGPLRGDDQHQAALLRRLDHHLVGAAELGVPPQGVRARVVRCMGERVLCLGLKGREAAVVGRGEGIHHRGIAQAGARFLHQVW